MLISERRGRQVASPLLIAAIWMTIVAPIVFGQGNSPQQDQGEKDKGVVSRTQKAPQWQTAAGGKLSFDVASIRLSKPGTFTPPSVPFKQ